MKIQLAYEQQAVTDVEAESEVLRKRRREVEAESQRLRRALQDALLKKGELEEEASLGLFLAFRLLMYTFFLLLFCLAFVALLFFLWPFGLRGVYFVN